MSKDKVIEIGRNTVEEAIKAPAPTILEQFEMVNHAFSADLVRTYSEEADMRELFTKVEELKDIIQRMVDANKCEIKLPMIVNFIENVSRIPQFFIDKGFTVASSYEEGPTNFSLELAIKW